MTKTMEDRLLYVQQRAVETITSDEAHNILLNIIAAAAVYWDGDGIEKLDFCLQYLGVTSIVFGGVNRLVWTPAFGFNPDRSSCNERFLKRYESIGPLPRGER